MHDLHRFLIDHNIAMLRAVAQVRGLSLDTNRQADAAAQLAVALLEPLSLRTALSRLSTPAREALDALVSTGGRMRAAPFDRRFGQVRPLGPGRLERESPWQEPASPAEELWFAGLVFRAFAQDEEGPGEFVFIPVDLLPLLPQPHTELPTFTVEQVPEPPAWAGDQAALVRDLFAYLVYLQNHEVRPYADGRLGRRDQAALRRRLAEPDERRLALLRHLARRLEFVRRQDELLRLDATPVRSWLNASPAQQLLVLQEAWRDDPTWNDLCRIPGLICDQETGWQNDPVTTRQRLLALLARCPLDVWWSATSFVTAVKTLQPDFQRPDSDYTSWYIRNAASGEYLSGFESWDRVEGALISDLLAGPLRWLGIVITASTGTTLACRLTKAGAGFLELLSQEPQSHPSPPIIIQPDFRIQVPEPANLYTRFQLERFADLERVGPPCYRLSSRGLSRALARGVHIEQILGFLQQASQGPVPTNVAGQLRMWAGRFGQVHLEEVTLLKVKQERFLKELSVLPETRDLIGQVLSPTSALVRKEDLPRLQRELSKLGYLPLPDAD